MYENWSVAKARVYLASHSNAGFSFFQTVEYMDHCAINTYTPVGSLSDCRGYKEGYLGGEGEVSRLQYQKGKLYIKNTTKNRA